LSNDCCFSALKTGVAESNGDVGILTGSSDIAVLSIYSEIVAKTLHGSPIAESVEYVGWYALRCGGVVVLR